MDLSDVFAWPLYPEDIALLNRLGIPLPTGHRLPHGQSTRLGSVQLPEGATVAITLTVMPAHFYQFDLHRGGRHFRFTAGSGTLAQYWPGVVALTQGQALLHSREMFDIQDLGPADTC